MKKKEKNLLLTRFKSLSLGTVNHTEEKREVYQDLNKELIDLCKSLPGSMQSDAIHFFMVYSRITPGEPLDFFSRYYSPIWSVIYHIYRLKDKSSASDKKSLHMALKGQALAMFLHSYDNHLNDGNIPVSHLALLLRSAAWMRFNEYIAYFAGMIPSGDEAVKNLINDYYTGVTLDIRQTSLEQYCGLFRKQMATGFIMPMCMARVAGIDNSTIELIQKSYESFGIAWRLLDDINDMEEDVKKKWRSAIYHSLPQNFQYLWNIKNMNKRYNKIAEILIKDAVLYRIIKKILLELKIAEKYSKKAGLEELAIEFSELYAPLVAMIEHD